MTGETTAGRATVSMESVLRQVRAVERAYPDTVVVVRLGDFYESLGDNAELIGEMLGVCVLERHIGESPVKMAGFPVVMLDAATRKVLAAGFRLATLDAGKS